MWLDCDKNTGALGAKKAGNGSQTSSQTCDLGPFSWGNHNWAHRTSADPGRIDILKAPELRSKTCPNEAKPEKNLDENGN